MMASEKVICTNRKVNFEYFILDKFEAGIKLTGTEIKSIRAGKVNINDAYVILRNNKVYIVNMFIAKYDYGNIFNHDELRSRELLLNMSEINKLNTKIKTAGLTVVALKAYFKGGLVKIEIALARGKKLQDKRETIKERDINRSIQKDIKNSYR